MLQYENSQLTEVLNSLPALMFFAGSDGTILWDNTVFKDFFGSPDVPGAKKTIGDLFPEDREDFTGDLSRVASSNEAKHGIIRRIDTPLAGTKTLRFSIIPYRSTTGNTARVMVFGYDITGQAELEQLKRDAYDQIERNIEQFATLGDHLRNPVAVIIGLCDLLDDKTIAEKIIRQAQEIDETIARIDQGWIDSEKVRTIIKKYYDVGVRGTHELVARAIHEEYVAQQTFSGMTIETNPSMRPWNELSRHLQDANLRQVDDIWKKLQKIHCAIAVVTDVNGPLFEFMPDEVEMLARHEHDRWMKDKQALGWKYGTEINERKRTHNCLVPWEYLPDQQKEKDRDAIRSLPGILLKVRLKIVRFERS